jgi:hypothetical protein
MAKSAPKTLYDKISTTVVDRQPDGTCISTSTAISFW